MIVSRKAIQRIVVVVATAAVLLVAATTAQAASVAYLDGNEVWVATTDGATRTRLSSGENDWRAVAQSDLGFIVGVRNEAGKISNLSSFTVWDPAGTRIHFGPLAGNSAGSSAYPLSLDITPDGKLLVYGFSQYIYGYPVGTLTLGHYLLPSVTTAAPVPEPYKNTNARWPTLFGERIVGTPDANMNAVQEAGSIGGTTFVPWADFSSIPDADLHMTDVAATGTIFASELYYDGAWKGYKIAVVPTSGIGGTLLPGDCFLNADDKARQPNLSQDGTMIAWQDGGGVKVGGVPNFSGAEPCVLTKPPVTISPTGSFPSFGPFNVPALLTSPAYQPTLTAPSTLKLTKLFKSGLSVTVSSVPGGTAKVQLTVKPKAVGKKGKKPIVIASGSAVVPAGSVATKIKLKATRKGRALKRKLKGKRATLTVTIGENSTAKTIKLK